MSPGSTALGWVAFTLISLMLQMDESHARPVVVKRSIRRKPPAKMNIKMVKTLTKKPHNLNICNSEIQLRLSGKKLNKKRYRFSTHDAMMVVPMLGGESIYERAYVWCRTASLYHSLDGNKRTFDVRSLNKFQLDITLRRDDVDQILAPFFPTLALRTAAFDAARKYMRRHSKKRVKRKLLPFETEHWYLGMIPYKIKDPELNFLTRDTIRKAVGLWEDSTCLRFHETERIFFQPHIFFRKGTGCSSSIGQKAFGQEISVGDGCENVGIIAHEIGHALGFFHEHSRPDRDRYIEIVEENLGRNAAQFSKLTWDNGMTLGIPYDYASVMHYGGTDFSPDDSEFTIKAKDDDMQRVLGQREGPSFLDIKLANWNYCADSCASNGLEWTDCKNGGYRNPNNCSTCMCPRGLAPPLCDKPSAGKNAECGRQEFIATEEEQILSTPGYDTPDGFYVDAFCPWLIKASSPGKRVRIQFIEEFYFTHDYAICEDYVEVRYKDISMVGPRLCGEDPPEKIYHSHGSKVLISASTLQVNWWQGFKLIYSEENCGGCSADAGADEPVCFRTVKYDCSPETGCKGRGCPPPRKNFCFRDEEYCCEGFALNQGRCTRQENSTNIVMKVAGSVPREHNKAFPKAHLATSTKPTTTLTTSSATAPMPTNSSTSTPKPTTSSTTTPKPTTSLTATPKPTTSSATTLNHETSSTSTPKHATQSAPTLKPTTSSTPAPKPTTSSTSTTKPTISSATTSNHATSSTTTSKQVTPSATTPKPTTASTTTPKPTTSSAITPKHVTPSATAQSPTTFSTTTPKPTTSLTTTPKPTTSLTTTPKSMASSTTYPKHTIPSATTQSPTTFSSTTPKQTTSSATTPKHATTSATTQSPTTVSTTTPKPATYSTTTLKPTTSSTTTPKPTTYSTTTPKLTISLTTTPKSMTSSTPTQKHATPSATTPKPTAASTTTPKQKTYSATTPKPATYSTTTLNPTTSSTITPKPATYSTTTLNPTTSSTITPKPTTYSTTIPKPTSYSATIPKGITSKFGISTSKSTTANWIATKSVSSPTQMSTRTALSSRQVKTWSGWSAWSDCSNTCGLCGERTRTRQCLLEPCSGPREEKERCGERICPDKPRQKSFRCQKTKPGCKSTGWFTSVKQKCQYSTTCTMLEKVPRCCVGKPDNGRCRPLPPRSPR